MHKYTLLLIPPPQHSIICMSHLSTSQTFLPRVKNTYLHKCEQAMKTAMASFHWCPIMAWYSNRDPSVWTRYIYTRRCKSDSKLQQISSSLKQAALAFDNRTHNIEIYRQITKLAYKHHQLHKSCISLDRFNSKNHPIQKQPDLLETYQYHTPPGLDLKSFDNRIHGSGDYDPNQDTTADNRLWVWSQAKSSQTSSKIGWPKFVTLTNLCPL